MNDLATIKASMDPLLTGLGFAAGQNGGDRLGETGDIIWCIGYDQVQRRYPWLPQARDVEHPTGTECVDLTVRVARGHVVAVDVENWSLEGTFTELGDGVRAGSAAGVVGVPAGEAGGSLLPLLVSVFRAGRPGSG